MEADRILAGTSQYRFKMLTKTKPEAAKVLQKQAQEDVDDRWKIYQYLASQSMGNGNGHQ